MGPLLQQLYKLQKGSDITGHKRSWFESGDLQSISDTFSKHLSQVYEEDAEEQFATSSESDMVTDVTPVFKDDRYLYDVVYPVVAAGACIILVIVIVVMTLTACRRRRNKNEEDGNSSGHSILVYPNHRGNGPQFLTKEIRFSVPPNRSSSLGDLDEAETADEEGDHDTDSLIPVNMHTHRSNSFSSYGLGAIDPALYTSTPELESFEWPEGHLGRLWFTLRYEPATEKLLVTLLKARNLTPRTVATVNSCDPFVRLHLIPDERRYLQSRQKKKTCNPYFDETFVFQISPKAMNDHILKLSVIDAGRTKRRSTIGHVTVNLRDLDVGEGIGDPQLFKVDLEREAQEPLSNLGELLLSLIYNSNLSRLTVNVIEARRIKFRDEHKEVYVRLTLNQQYRAIKVKRTGSAKPQSDGCITFSEGFHLKIPAAQQDLCSVALHLMQTSAGYGRDKLIGKCVLGSYMFARGKALTHWNTAFANPMEQVQQWHALCE